MTVQEIRKLCANASSTYYDFLERNDKGIYKIHIRNIERIGDDKFKLKISHKIFDEETIAFRYLPSNQEWTIEAVKIQVYDKDSNTLVIKPTSEVRNLFTRSTPNDWLIISDLKFLVERVRQWYEINGSDIELPQRKSVVPIPKPSLFFKEKEFQPSSEQIEALQAVFRKPLTYIWGAPGTGKTQFVLSYAILHYLGNKKKVAIMAPTNHALEQIYRGVIKMTDKAGISREKILRLGGPSKKFAEEFPEVCEIIGLEKQLDEINKQIKTIEKLLGLDEDSEELKVLELMLKELDKIQVERETKTALKGELEKVTSSLESKRTEERATELEIESQKREVDLLYNRKHSLLGRIASVFGKKVDFDKEIKKLQWNQVVLESKVRKWNGARSQLEKDKENVEELIRASESKIKKYLSTFSSLLKGTRIVLDSKFNTANVEGIRTKIEEVCAEIKDDQPTYGSLFEEYKIHDPSYLKDKLKKLFAEKDRLANYSTEQRLRNVSIIGATLDTYLYRFMEATLEVDHIFLDEAGYSNIIKAQTLFNQGVPVTFLGDHKQLPPVCEMSKKDIVNNETYRPVMVWDQSAIFLEDLYEIKNLDMICYRYLNNMEATFKSLVKHNLTTTFRFGSRLSGVLERFVYPDGFTSKRDVETEIIIYHVENPPGLRDGTRKNEAEVMAITNLLQQKFDPEGDIAVLAPYNDQIKALAGRLPQYHNNNKLLTVHKSQGQEWKTVVYSVCDSGNGKGPLVYKFPK